MYIRLFFHTGPCQTPYGYSFVLSPFGSSRLLGDTHRRLGPRDRLPRSSRRLWGTGVDTKTQRIKVVVNGDSPRLLKVLVVQEQGKKKKKNCQDRSYIEKEERNMTFVVFLWFVMEGMKSPFGEIESSGRVRVG